MDIQIGPNFTWTTAGIIMRNGQWICISEKSRYPLNWCASVGLLTPHGGRQRITTVEPHLTTETTYGPPMHRHETHHSYAPSSKFFKIILDPLHYKSWWAVHRQGLFLLRCVFRTVEAIEKRNKNPVNPISEVIVDIAMLLSIILFVFLFPMQKSRSFEVKGHYSQLTYENVIFHTSTNFLTPKVIHKI